MKEFDHGKEDADFDADDTLASEGDSLTEEALDELNRLECPNPSAGSSGQRSPSSEAQPAGEATLSSSAPTEKVSESAGIKGSPEPTKSDAKQVDDFVNASFEKAKKLVGLEKEATRKDVGEKVRGLITDGLSSDDPETRDGAFEQLKEIGLAALKELAIAMASSPDGSVRILSRKLVDRMVGGDLICCYPKAREFQDRLTLLKTSHDGATGADTPRDNLVLTQDVPKLFPKEQRMAVEAMKRELQEASKTNNLPADGQNMLQRRIEHLSGTNKLVQQLEEAQARAQDMDILRLLQQKVQPLPWPNPNPGRGPGPIPVPIIGRKGKA